MNAELALLAAGAAVAGLVQGISGFAFSMVAMSIWVWGVEPRVAALMAVFGSLSGQILSAVTVRRAVDLQLLAPFLAGALAGIPLGVWAVAHVDAQLFKAGLGASLVVFCPTMLLAERLPRLRLGSARADRLGDCAAGALGGVMGGLGGFTGVVPALWCTLKAMDKDAQRAVIQNFNLAALAATMAVYVGTGAFSADLWPRCAVVLPALVLPNLLGTRIYRGLSPLAFRRVVLALLSAAGLVMLAAGVPALLARA
ncbi:MAG: hypothetical protein RLZZ584_4185 [Pseudomonadota bacterium]|jgi:uncharacterized membrane protein YfcA